MSRTAELLGVDGPKHVFTDPETGDKYPLNLVNDELLCALEKNLYQRRLAIVVSQKTLLTPEEYRDALAAVGESYFTGSFGYKSETGQKYLKSPTGSFALAALIFDLSENDLLRFVTKYPAEVEAVIKVVLKESGY